MSENEYQSSAPSKQTSSVPLKKETVRVTLKAADAPPSIPSATVQMAPAPTIRLASAAPTGMIKPAGGAPPTIALPKATVQLQTPTRPLGTSFSSPSQMATVQADEEDEVDEGGGLVKILAGVGFAAALVVLALQVSTASTWVNAEDNSAKGDWMQLFS